MADRNFDRAAEDVGNIVGLEHVNVLIADQSLAGSFYISALGLTRDPYLMVHTENMWINCGQEQFHLPTGKPQVLRGTTGLVIQDYDALPSRLASVREKLGRTAYSFTIEDKHIDVTCPWGNRLRCHAPAAEFGNISLGVPYVEFTVKPGTAEGIARFYSQVMEAPAVCVPNGAGNVARVRMGGRQELRFKETTAEIPAYDGHHIAIYIANFSRPHKWLKDNGLVSEESNPYQYRFVDIVDPDTKKCLFQIEHEVRSYTHPMFMRPMVNRNPAQRQPTYKAGHDAFVPGLTW